MADRMTPRQRSRCMASIKGKDTRPELAVRKFLYAQGLRFRVNNHRLPGSPDIVLPRYRTVIFVDGCFWHGHEGCQRSRLPLSNVEYWRHKITLNKARDYRVDVELRSMGWRVMHMWECEINEESLQLLYQRVICTPGIMNISQPYMTPPDSDIPHDTAAEPTESYGLPY